MEKFYVDERSSADARTPLEGRMDERAERAALLVDGDAYDRAVRATAIRARRTPFVVGWDIHSRMRLAHPSTRALPPRLGPSRRSLSPSVVVDNQVAFVGGLDLTDRRWDTPQHGLDDPRRVDCARELLTSRTLEGALAGALRHPDDPEVVLVPRLRGGSLIAAIEALRGGVRTLRPRPPEPVVDVDAVLPVSTLLDPPELLGRDWVLPEVLPSERRDRADRRLLGGAILVALAVVLASAWRSTPLGDSLDARSLLETVGGAATDPVLGVWALAVYLVASLTAFPLTLLIVATGAVFGAFPAFGYAFAGALVAVAALLAGGIVALRRLLDRGRRGGDASRAGGSVVS